MNGNSANLSNLASTLMVRYNINPNYFANAFSANLSPKVQKKKNPGMLKDECKCKNTIFF